MHRKTLETPVSSKTIFSHPGISYRPDKKDRFEFSDDAKEVLKQFIKNRFQGHDMEQES